MQGKMGVENTNICTLETLGAALVNIVSCLQSIVHLLLGSENKTRVCHFSISAQENCANYILSRNKPTKKLNLKKWREGQWRRRGDEGRRVDGAELQGAYTELGMGGGKLCCKEGNQGNKSSPADQ